MRWVQILMSTYNGEKYLPIQLDSILNQTYPYIKILIRDDGSTDSTLRVIKSYAKRNKNISFIQGENIGVIASYFELIRQCDKTVSYYAFSDQDDKWLPKKIECALKKIVHLEGEEGRPVLYCSNTIITDENLNFISYENKRARPSFGNALVQNICTGCTAVIDASLMRIVVNTKPQKIIMHDWWLYITATIYGNVYYDKNAYILYRQHKNNVYGVKKSVAEIWKYRFEQLGKKRGQLYSQLSEIIYWYPDMNVECREKLELLIQTQSEFKARWKVLWTRDIYRNKLIDDFVFRGIVLLGKM